MYSGQLDLGAQETSEIRFRFVARAPHFVVVPGQRTGIEAERAPSKDGTYAAFTTTAPIEESDFVAMIDPGLPGALQQTVRALFPALLRHYRDAATSVCALLRGRGRLDDDPARARYACGAVIELIASNGDAPGAERIWNRLLGSTRGSGLYDVAALFAAARQARAPEHAVEAAESLARPGAHDGVARMAQGLALAGYSLTARADAPARFQQVALEAGKPGARWLAVGPAAAR